MRTLMLIAAVASLGATAKQTTWVLRNEADKDVVITCALEADASNVKLSMTSPAIRAGKELRYEWGTGLDNDGLGLNGGRWRCEARDARPEAQMADAGGFVTDWGEASVLTVAQDGGRWRVTKRSGAVSVAPKAPAAGVTK